MRLSFDRTRFVVLAALLLVPSAAAAGGLDSFLDEVEIRARVDLGSFKADLSATFGVSERRIDGIFEVLSRPSDVYMCLRIGELANVRIDRCVEEFQTHGGQGWGAIAKNLGIKPGSSEFHALKEGRLPARGQDGSTVARGNGGGGKNKNKKK